MTKTLYFGSHDSCEGFHWSSYEDDKIAITNSEVNLKIPDDNNPMTVVFAHDVWRHGSWESYIDELYDKARAVANERLNEQKREEAERQKKKKLQNSNIDDLNLFKNN